MSRLKDLLHSYVYNPSIENRFDLAEEYFRCGQYAAALSFYLKTAETTTDKNLQYYCLIRCGICFEIPKNRKHSVLTLYKHALHLLPDRPEAYYYLSRAHELYSDWYDCYTFAHLGLQKPNISDTYSKKLKYQGTYTLLFQKAISAWHIGKGQESRKLLQQLIHEYGDELDEVHKALVVKNASSLGSGPLEIAHVPYHKSKHKLRYEFNNYAKVEHNYSQVLQDIFVLSMLDGKQNGRYLEIGSGDPIHLNNSFLLESQFNWTGVGVEYNQELADKHSSRTNKVLCKNALDINYSELLETIAQNNIVDYLQLDCEPSNVTYEIMTKIPFHNFKFRVITYEHDHYIDISRTYRNKSREFLQQQGYLLVVNDVSPEGSCTFEDWWVHPQLVDSTILAKMLDNNLAKIKNIKEYMFL
jgi:tetratricopeptide (TPR) repeat protein